MQFVILTKFAGACYTKLQEKPCHDLLIICMEKKITKARQTKFCMLFVIFICYNFAHVLHENALAFSQSEVRNFLMYITFSFNPVHFLSKRLEYTNEPCFRRWSNFFKATISQLKVAFCKIKLGVSWACTTDQGLSFKHLIVAIVDA